MRHHSVHILVILISLRLHYKVTMGLVLACSLLVTAVQLVTDPITCDVKVRLRVESVYTNTTSLSGNIWGDI